MKLAPVLVLVACLTSANSALAHAHLKAETPPADAVVAAVARDSGKIGFGRHTNYYGSAGHHQPIHGLGKFWRGVGYHAYDPHCSMGEESKYPPWSFC